VLRRCLILGLLTCACSGPAKIPVRVARPSKGDLVAHFVCSGRVKSHLVKVNSGQNGRLIQVNVKENQKVRKGQILAELDPRELSAELDSYRAELEVARSKEAEAMTALALKRSQLSGQLSTAVANQNRAEAQLSLTRRRPQEELAEARSAEDSARARLTLAEKELRRSRQLFEQEILSRAKLDQSETEFRTAQAELRQCQARVQKQSLLPRPETLWVAQADLGKARAERQSSEDSYELEMAVYEQRLRVAMQETQRSQARLEAARVRMERVHIRAPQDGVVFQVNVENGEQIDWIQPLFTMLSTQGLRIEAEVDEQDAAKVHLSMPVEASFPSLPGQRFLGKVAQMAPVLERRTRGPAESRILRIRVELQQAPGSLKDGQEAEVQGNTVLARQVLLLPRSALLREGNRDSVLTVAQGKTNRQEVALGAATSDQVEVKSGLSPETLVVVEGGDRVSPGTEVEAIP